MGAYRSCSCKWCRSVPTKIKGEHKRLAHRMLRRAAKRAMHRGTEAPTAVSTGYKY